MYTLSEAAEATGVAAQTLHAWERRYGAITPQRTATDRRLYTFEDIQRLRLLKAGVGLGHRISTLVLMENEKLQNLLADGGRETHFELLKYLRQMDFRNFERALSAIYSTLGPTAFIKSIVVPLMVEIGDLWENGLLSITAEHIGTSMIRSYTASSLHFGNSSRPKSTGVFTTFEGELHELGILGAAVLAQNLEVNCIYLGPQLPANEIVEAAKHFKADFICLGAKTISDSRMLVQIETLVSGLHEDVEILIGGHPARNLRKWPDRCHIIPSFEDFERKIKSKHAA